MAHSVCCPAALYAQSTNLSQRFPINITGGNGGKQLDMLSMSNVNKKNPNGYKFFAHAIVGWIFFGFVLFLVSVVSLKSSTFETFDALY